MLESACRVGVRISVPRVGAVGAVELGWDGNITRRDFGCLG